jgi:hypothetical protein
VPKPTLPPKTISPATDTSVATIDLTKKQLELIEKVMQELLEAEATVALRKRKYIVADDEALTKDAGAHIRNKILHIPG